MYHFALTVPVITSPASAPSSSLASQYPVSRSRRRGGRVKLACLSVLLTVAKLVRLARPFLFSRSLVLCVLNCLTSISFCNFASSSIDKSESILQLTSRSSKPECNGVARNTPAVSRPVTRGVPNMSAMHCRHHH
jgi:hypothetical protein